jgi:hypothetical protein
VTTELESIEQEMGLRLDDESVPLLEQVRAQSLLSDEEWKRLRCFVRESLQFLSEPNRTVIRDGAGQLVFDTDADPRNADWIRIAAANRLAGYVLPMWAALWLWRLKTDTSKTFWRRVGEIASVLGCAPYK